MKTNNTLKNRLLLITAVLCIGCTQQELTIHTEQVWLVDSTDSLVLRPDTVYIKKQLAIDNTIWEARKITFGVISDYHITPEKTVFLPKENNLLGNAHIRRIQVNSFMQSIAKNLFTLMPKEATTKTRSLVFIPISKYLEQLSKSAAKYKTLYIYSNLMENNPSTLSFYNTEVLAQLQSDPNAIAQLLEKEGSISDLTGITIYLMYYPNNQRDNEHYHIVATFYKNLFESHNATVYLKASH